MTQQLTTEILNAALENLTAKRHQIDEQIAQIRRMLGNNRNGGTATSEPATRKHRISAAGRRAIAVAQRRRWAEKKAAAGSTSAVEAKKPERKLSAAGRQAIVTALKKRWAAKRAEGAGTSKATPKSTRPRAA